MGDVKYKFVGQEGEYLMGVPARDLTDDDIRSLDEAQQEQFKAHLKTDRPLYEKPAKETPKEAVKEETKKVTEE